MFRPETGLCCSFESIRAPRSLPNFRIAIRSTGLWRELEASPERELVLLCAKMFQVCAKIVSFLFQVWATVRPRALTGAPTATLTGALTGALTAAAH